MIRYSILGVVGNLNDTVGRNIFPDSLTDLMYRNLQETIASSATANFELIRDLASTSIVLGILVGIAVYFLTVLFSRVRIGTMFLKVSFVLAWLFSFVVYDVGMCIYGEPDSLFWNIPMAMLHAFGSFVLSSDVSEIHSRFYESQAFMACFSISHVLSAFVSSLFILRVFGFNFRQKILMHWQGMAWNSRRETYVIWGINNSTFKMVESINKHYQGNRKAYRIVVVKTADEEDSTDTAVGLNRVFEVLSLKRTELDKLQTLGCYFASSKTVDMSVVNLKLESDGESQANILRDVLRLRSLAKLLTPRCTTEKIHFLFLSDDENQNLHDVSLLLQDSVIDKFYEEGKDTDQERKVIFYCHARYNGVHRVIEDLHCSNNKEVRIIDSSHINVELLKRNEKILPVQFVEVEKDATVSTAFNAMVVGFSEVGQDATRFLYEFGAFVRKGGDDDRAERSEFHLDVIDNRMKDKAGTFVFNSPSIKLSLPFIEGGEDSTALIELHDIDCESVEFFAILERRISTLNYLVIATDNDELNMSLGVRIYRAAKMYRKDMKKLCILIRIHRDDDGHYSRIAKYYNRLWAAQEHSDAQAKIEAEMIAKNPDYKHPEEWRRNDLCYKDVQLPLYIFGEDEDVYSYENIIDNSILMDAVEYKELYEISTNKEYARPTKERDKAWYKEVRSVMPGGKEDSHHPSDSEIMRLRRTQGQDMANSHHKITKRLLSDNALTKLGLSEYNWGNLSRLSEDTKYLTTIVEKEGDEEKIERVEEVSPDILRILRVLAQTEHLRWNASHEILGYVYKDRKDECRMWHNCLQDWEKLSERVRSYDNNVVDISLGTRHLVEDKDEWERIKKKLNS